MVVSISTRQPYLLEILENFAKHFSCYLYTVWTMCAGTEVSQKSAFPASFDILTIFNRILWMWTSLQNDQNLTSVFLFHDIIEAFYFLTAIENGE